MKYTITINQSSISDAGFAGGKTDLIDWAIIDYISAFCGARSGEMRGNKVLIDVKSLLDRMPLIDVNPEAVFGKLINLSNIGLLDIDLGGDGTLFASISKSAWSITTGMSIERCTYCGISGVVLETDHIIPKSRGGDNSATNLTPACRQCNNRKGANMLAEWKPSGGLGDSQ